jgi:DNA polymerase (family 10)
MKQTKLFQNNEPKILEQIPLETAKKIGGQICFLVSQYLHKCEIVGSVRRKKPFCKDIDIIGVATPERFEKAIQNIKREFGVEFKVKGKKVTKLFVTTQFGKIQVDLYCVTPETFGLNKIIRTGSAEHNMWLATYAISKGYRVNYSKGLLKNGKPVAGRTEEDVFSKLGLLLPKPENREIIDRKPIWLIK